MTVMAYPEEPATSETPQRSFFQSRTLFLVVAVSFAAVRLWTLSNSAASVDSVLAIRRLSGLSFDNVAISNTELAQEITVQVLEATDTASHNNGKSNNDNSANDSVQQKNQMEQDDNIAVIHYDTPKPADQHDDKIVLCTIIRDEEAYIDEYVDYHIGMGFDLIRLYDNSPDMVMKQWADKKGSDKVELIHFPFEAAKDLPPQQSIYRDCARRAQKEQRHKWIAFWDADDFLVLYQHDTVHDFLQDFIPDRGQVVINWRCFGTGGQMLYSPEPVLKRFTMRLEDNDITNKHVKTLMNVNDVDTSDKSDWRLAADCPPRKEGTPLMDTHRQPLQCPFIEDPFPKDVALLHHYQRKSAQEYINKRLRGRPDTKNRREAQDMLVTLARQEMWNYNGTIFDDIAWRLLKKNVPKYAAFDKW